MRKLGITEITYMRRVNLGNYEHTEISATSVVNEGQDPDNIGEALKQQVEKLLGLRDSVDFSLVEEVTEDGNFKMKDGSVKEVSENTEVVHEDKKEEPKEEEKPKATKKKVTKKKASKKKEEPKGPVPSVKYDRSKQEHKDEMAKALNQHVAKWKTTDEGKKKARELSEKLVGEYLFDSEGNVVSSFIEAVKDGMK